ncbi:MAG: preprotein translocase subunit SecG [Anaerolineae bacterium]|nr:preprotein translocase subunit SecG [Anaerolineae bacterium]
MSAYMSLLSVVQIILSVALVVLVLLEVRSSGVGSAFGGGLSSLTRKRRGPELLIFRLTVGTSIVFFLIAILNILIAG